MRLLLLQVLKRYDAYMNSSKEAKKRSYHADQHQWTPEDLEKSVFSFHNFFGIFLTSWCVRFHEAFETLDTGQEVTRKSPSSLEMVEKKQLWKSY